MTTSVGLAGRMEVAVGGDVGVEVKVGITATARLKGVGVVWLNPPVTAVISREMSGGVGVGRSRDRRAGVELSVGSPAPFDNSPPAATGTTWRSRIAAGESRRPPGQFLDGQNRRFTGHQVGYLEDQPANQQNDYRDQDHQQAT